MPNQNVFLKLPVTASQSVAWPSGDNTFTRIIQIDLTSWLSFVFAPSITSVALVSASNGAVIASLANSAKGISFTQTSGTNDATNLVVLAVTTSTGRVENVTLDIPIQSFAKQSGPIVYAVLSHAVPAAAATATPATATDLQTEVTSRQSAEAAASKRLGYIALSDYNPVGDGATDDAPAFNAAIAAAKARAAANQYSQVEIVVSGGAVYGVSSLVKLTDVTSVSIRIVGRGKPRIKAIGPTGGIFNITGSNVAIERLVLDGNVSAHPSNFASAIAINAGSTAVTVRDCEFVNPTGGIAATGASGLVIEGNLFTNSKLHGVYFNGVFDSRVERNVVKGSIGFGVILTNGCYRNLIQNNYTPQNGIELVGVTQDSYENRIIGNHSENTGDNGISITGYKNVVMGNICKGCQGNGIELYGERNLVVGNTCLNNAKGNAGNTGWRGGIAIQGGFGGIAQNNTVTGNICDDDQAVPTQVYGVWCGPSGYTAWATGQVIAPNGGGTYRFVGGNLYKNTAGGTTGATQPSHTSGTVNDGGVDWAFVRAALQGVLGAFGNQIAANNISRFGTAKYGDFSGATGPQVNEVSASFQPLVLPSTLTVSSIGNAGGVSSITVSGTNTIPNGPGGTVAISAPNQANAQQAAAHIASYFLVGFGALASGGTGYTVNDVITLQGGTTTAGGPLTLRITAVNAGVATTFTSNGGTFTYTSLPPVGNAVWTGGTGTGFTTSGMVWRVNAIAIDSPGSGYTTPPTVTLSGFSGTPTIAVITTASLAITAGSGALTLDGNGTKLGAVGGVVSMVAPQVNATAVRVVLANAATYTVLAATSLVKLIPAAAIATGTISLPLTGVIDSQELEIVNLGGLISSLIFSGSAVGTPGYGTGQPLTPGGKIRLVFDLALAKWYVSQTQSLPVMHGTQALTYAATTAWNVLLGGTASVVLTGNTILATPANLQPGFTGRLKIVQDATGSRTITWPANTKWAGGVAGVLSTTANAIDLLTFTTLDGVEMLATLTKAYA